MAPKCNMIAYQRKLFIETVHFLNNGFDLLTERLWRQYFQLVGVIQNLLNEIVCRSYLIFKNGIYIIRFYLTLAMMQRK